MNDVIPQLATATLPFVLAHLDYIRGKVADSALSEGGKALVGVLKDKWFGKRDGAKAAVEDAVKAPEDADNREALLVELKKALKADPEFAESVKRLSGEAGIQLSVTGDGNKTAVAQGTGNSISIS